jgi:small ligand-binding sensory domain FIST
VTARFAAGLSQHPVPVEAVGEAVGDVVERLEGEQPDLVLLFASPHHVGAFDDIASATHAILEPAVMLGATAVAVVGGPREVEDGPGLSVFAACLPGAGLTPMTLGLAHTPDGPSVVGWPPDVPDDGTLLLLADPFSFPGDAFLARLNDDRPGTRAVGGFASAARGPGGNRLALGRDVTAEGAVGVFIDAGVEIVTVVSQGCRPVGRPYVVTRGEQNVIAELAGQPALDRLQAMIASLSAEERELLGQGLHVGLVVDEHGAEFGRGDFLIRNVMGIDRDTGAVAIGDAVEVGQTVQFHVRDAASADEDLRELLAGAKADAALLFTCNGRGRNLFSEPDHDAGLLDSLLGPLPVAGMFCGGEVGPVGGRNFLHGFTASMALLRA